MNNDEAMVLLTAKQFTIGGTINDLNRFVDENGDWKDDVKAAKMASIKTSATSVGVDLAAWTGQPAPAV
jgi:hypothetical protein